MATNPLEAVGMGTGLDPYAPIRTLPRSWFDRQSRNSTRQYMGNSGSGSGEGSNDVFGYVEDAPTYGLTPEGFGGLEGLGGGRFQSKFGEVVDMGENRMAIKYQDPGKHKYDLLNAIYSRPDANSDWALEGDPSAARQASTFQTFYKDPLEQFGKDFVLPAAAMYFGAQGLQGLMGAQGAGGAAAGAGAAEAGIGTLGTIAPGSAAVAPLTTTGLATAGPALGSIPQIGGGLLAAGGAGAMTAGEQIAFLAANGMTDAAIVSAYPGLAAAGGLTGVGAGAVSAGALAAEEGIKQLGTIAPGSAVEGGMDWSDWAKIGTKLVGAGIQSNAANKAVDAQAAGTDAAIAEQRRQFDQMRADSTPYREAGANALSQFQTLTNTPTTAADVMQDPGYQFGLDQGQQAIDRKVAAMGGRVSGQAIKAAARFGTNYATTGFTAADQRRNDRLNRLASLAGIGQSATNASASAGSAMANNISGLVTGQGNAAGGGILAQGNIWGNTANQLAALYGRGSQQTGNMPPTSPFANFGGDYNSLDYRP